MAVGSILGSVKNKARSIYNRFFYDTGEAPAPRMQEQENLVQDPAGAWQNPAAYPGQESYPQQPGYQQPYPQSAYQAQVYTQGGAPASGYYQQPVQQQAQIAGQGRFRRSQQHAARSQGENVVNFTAYQRLNQPGQSAVPEVEQENAGDQQQNACLLSARVINARGMGDCRSAITLLRNGDAVVIVMEGISDPTEMRRLVDTLSGACYSLTATITKVSRHGVYLLAPQTLAVFADQATNAMNTPPARAQQRNYQPAFAGQRAAYAPQQPIQQPVQQPVQQQPPQQPQQQNVPYAGGFTQRSVTQQEPAQRFYQRPAPQAAQAPAFSAQPVAYGYAPDETAAAE